MLAIFSIVTQPGSLTTSYPVTFDQAEPDTEYTVAGYGRWET